MEGDGRRGEGKEGENGDGPVRRKCVNRKHERDTYVVSSLQEVFKILVHAVVVHGHEECVDGDTESDEQFHKWIKDNGLNKFCKSDPNPTTVPDTEEVDAFHQVFVHFSPDLILKSFFLLVCREIIVRNCKNELVKAL